jgi:tetraacyldisaccharide 4'-kinase
LKKIIGSWLESIYRFFLVKSQNYYRRVPSRIRKVKAQVISVGNITWGGTGKTPLIIHLATALSEQGKNVAVLIRGYGRDEVLELRKKLEGIPVVVGRDRIKSAHEAIQKYKADVLLLDDGFQHIRLHRDLDIVTLNSTQPFGPGGLIPVGTLREPIENLSRAHIFILTKSDIGSKNIHWIRQKISTIKPEAVIFEASHKVVAFTDEIRHRSIKPTELQGRRVATLCGIGDPFSFEKSVEIQGCQILYAARFEDHHVFARSELRRFISQAKKLGCRDAITTQKDWMRLGKKLRTGFEKELNDFTFWISEIEFQVHDEEDFIRRCVNS